MATQPRQAQAAGGPTDARAPSGSIFHSVRSAGLRAFGSAQRVAPPPPRQPASQSPNGRAGGPKEPAPLPLGKGAPQAGPAKPPMLSLIAAPFVVFTASCVAYMLFWCYTMLPLGLTAVALVVGLTAGLPPPHRRDAATPGAKLLPAGMCLLGAVAGVVMGVYTYEFYLAPFYAMGFGRNYDNVLASTPGAAYMDAGRLRFADTSSVQTDMTLGYRVGPTYCVAPIMDSGPQQVRKVTFWAIGLDCCASRGSFSCGSGAEDARGGIRAVPDGIFVRSRSEYVQALKQAASIYDLVVDSNPILIHWVSDPAAEQRAKLWGALMQLGFGMLFMGVVSLGAFTLDSVLGFSRGTTLEGQLPT